MGEHGGVRPTSHEFRAAWPRIVRVLAAWSGSLDDAEEYAAEAMARAVTQDDVDIDNLAAWCVRVAKRAWIDDHRRRGTFARLAPELASQEAMAAVETGEIPDELDDRLALLFVACDEALAPGRADGARAARRLRSHRRRDRDAPRHPGERRGGAADPGEADAGPGPGRVPGPRRSTSAASRLPVVLDCVAGMFTVAHRTVLDPGDALADLGRQALSIADALVVLFPDDTEVRGLRAVVRLGLARRPARVGEDGVALTLDEVDRSHWDQRLLRAGLDDAAFAASGDGRFALEAAISGVHSVAPSVAQTDWPRIVQLYTALEQVWPSPVGPGGARSPRTPRSPWRKAPT